MASKWGERLHHHDSSKDIFGDNIAEPEDDEEQVVTVVDGRCYGRSVFEANTASGNTDPPEKVTSLKGIELTIPHFKTVKNAKGHSFMVYVLQCIGTEQSWQVCIANKDNNSFFLLIL